jgi:uncharacterized protein YprB with RNaseH-like and TPR domain
MKKHQTKKLSGEGMNAADFGRKIGVHPYQINTWIRDKAPVIKYRTVHSGKNHYFFILDKWVDCALPILAPEEVARKARLSPTQLTKYCRRGLLTCRKFGRLWRIVEDERCQSLYQTRLEDYRKKTGKPHGKMAHMYRKLFAKGLAEKNAVGRRVTKTQERKVFPEAYLDIETADNNTQITIVGILKTNGSSVSFQQFTGEHVTKENIEKALLGAKVLYTFCGKTFDLPRLKALLGVDIAPYHSVDLRDVFQKQAHLTLVQLEDYYKVPRWFYIKRVTGKECPGLWANWLKGDYHSLHLLLEKNEADCYGLYRLKKKYQEVKKSKVFGSQTVTRAQEKGQLLHLTVSGYQVECAVNQKQHAKHFVQLVSCENKPIEFHFQSLTPIPYPGGYDEEKC